MCRSSGSGGVRTGRDALELLLAGASMVGVGTAIVHDPSACSRVVRELEEELTAMAWTGSPTSSARPTPLAGPSAPAGCEGSEREEWP